MANFIHFSLLLISWVGFTSAQICAPWCDGWDPILLSCPIREVAGIDQNGRHLALRVSDSGNMAWALATNCEGPNDEVWLDRTWDGGLTHEGMLGRKKLDPDPSIKHVASLMYNIDDPPARRVGAIRACGNLGGQTTCTPWGRSAVHSEGRLDAAITALMMHYEPWRGLYGTIGWWNSANAITVMIDYQRVTGRTDYEFAFDNTFELNKDENQFGGWNFTFGSIDDNLWWGLAWLRAYDLTGQQKYLDMAVFIADYCWVYHDDVCGGGIWWSDARTYKNAVTNEQYIKLAAQLHNRIEGDTKFGDQARRLWDWFIDIGMINDENLINDGLHECGNNRQPTWTYNQGLILGAAAELHKGYGDPKYLEWGRRLADASTTHPNLHDEHGALKEPGTDCPAGRPDPNCACFKGIYMRNLVELNLELEDRPYDEYILKQASLNYERNRNSIDQYGLWWSGPFDMDDASRQQSAVDALIAAEIVERDRAARSKRKVEL